MSKTKGISEEEKQGFEILKIGSIFLKHLLILSISRSGSKFIILGSDFFTGLINDFTMK